MEIHEACRLGKFDTVRSLVEGDSSLVDAPDQYQWRPIFHAALHCHLRVVQYLLESGADVAAEDGSVLHYASEVPGNEAIVRLLVMCGALDAHVRPADDLSRQFLSAVFLSDKARVRSLLGLHRHLASQRDGRGDLPIHHAARGGESEIVQLLIDHGADVNAANERGHTVLYCAGGHGHLDTVKLLLRQGADVSARLTSDGQTLLQWLAQYPEDERFQAIAEVLDEHAP